MRKLAWFSGGFGAACLLACYGPGASFLIPAALLLFGAALILRRLVRPKKGTDPTSALRSPLRRRLFQLSRRAAAFCLGGTLAALWFAGYTALFYSPARHMAGTEQTITATVATYPERTSIGGWSMVVKQEGGWRSPDILMYGTQDWGGLRPGDRITCTARFKGSEHLYGEETTHYSAKGVFLLGYCDDPPVTAAAEKLPLRFWPKACAKALLGGIYDAFGPKAAPLTAAVTLGDKEGLSDQLHSALTRSGMMHAAVVSGMHISFLVAVMLFLCRGNRRVALSLLPLLIFYACMVGGTPSAFRAVIMQTALLAGPVLGREHDGPSALGLALLILLIQNPYSAASISLQLSFASVAGILLVSARLSAAMLAPLRRRWNPKGALGRFVLRLARALAANIAVTLGAMLFTTPLIVLYFRQISLVAPLSNLLALWAATALTVCGLVLGALAVFFPGVSAIPGAIAGLLAHHVTGVVSLLSRWPLSSLDGSNPYFMVWLLALYLFLLTILFSQRKLRQTILSAAALALLLAGALLLNRETLRRTNLTLTALDVGQGAAALIQSGGKSLLVDCGGSGINDPGDLAADRLAALGTRRLDALVLTHLDDDHFNGVSQLLWRLEVERIYLPHSTADPANLTKLLTLADTEGAQVCFVTEIQTLALGGCTVTLYPPLSGGTSNEEGLFVLCSHGEFDALITGDADSFVEKMLLKYYPIPDLELLLVGHHGSRHSTGEALLEALRPELAIISVGYNSYGHPAEETLIRLSLAGAAVYRTDLNGPVTVRWKDGLISVS